MKQTMMKSLVSLLLVAVLCVGAVLPVFAVASECPAQHDITNCNYEVVKVVEAECGKQGYTDYKCTACGKPFAGNFVASDHDEYKVVDVEAAAPTCTTPGNTEGWHCTECGKTVESEPIEVVAHSFGAWTLDGASCATATKEKRTCSVCNATETRDRETTPDAHDWVLDKETFVAPTCKTEGSATYVCDDCGATKSGKVAIVGTLDAHVWGETVVVTAPTCNAKGSGTHTCTACGIVETVEIEKTTTHDVEVEDLINVTANAATCTLPGNNATKKCSVCEGFVKVDGNQIVDDTNAVIAPLGHEMGADATINGKVTCIGAAVAVYTCERCDATVTQIIGPAGHDWVLNDDEAPTCTDWGYEVKICRVCGEDEVKLLEPLNHSEKVKYEGDNETYKPHAVTCGSYPYYYEYCKLCGVNPDGSYNFDKFVKVEDRTVTLPAHTWSDAEGNAAADTKSVPGDCVNKAYTYKYCSTCNTEKPDSRVYGSIVPHTEDADGPYTACTTYIVTTIANCIDGTAGKIFVGCTKCGLELSEITIPAAHDYVLDKTHADYDEPNCADKATDTKGGKLVYVCQYEHEGVKCTASYTQEVEETVHTWTEYGTGNAKKNYQKVEATCQDAAHNLYTCSRCTLTVKDYEPYKNDTVVTNTNKYHVNSAWDDDATTDLLGNPLTTPGFYQVCTKTGDKALQVWYCEDCDNGFYVAVDHVWDETNWVAGKPADFVAATCTKEGATGTYVCKLCEYTKASTTISKAAHDLQDVAQSPAAADVRCNSTVTSAHKDCKNCDYTEGKVVTQPHTDKITLVASAVAPTCQTKGLSTTYYKCAACNKFLTATITKTTGENNKEVITYSNIVYKTDAEIKAFELNTVAHSGRVFDSAVADCDDFGYKATDCQWCNYVLVYDYDPANGHTWGTTATSTQAQTCEKGASATYTCTVDGCGATNVVYDTTKPATGHITADPDGDGPLTGTKIFRSCLDTHKDRTCVNDHCDYADKKVPNGHEYNETFYAATCYEYAYTYYVCSFCARSYAEYDETQPKPDHQMTNWAPLATNNKKEERHCVNFDYCGVKEERSIQTLYMEYDIDNGVKADANFVNTGIVELKISTSASDLAIYGLGLVIKYNNTVLSYIDAEVLSESFAEIHVGGIDGDATATTAKAPNGVLRINAYASVSATNMSNTTLNGDEVLVTVRFRINADVAAGTTANFNIDLDGSSATTKDGEAVNVVWHDTDNNDTTDDTVIGTITTVALGDVAKYDTGDTITMADATQMLRIITGEEDIEYLAEADIDKDGKITAADFAAMQKYLVSGDYEALVMNGVN